MKNESTEPTFTDLAEMLKRVEGLATAMLSDTAHENVKLELAKTEELRKKFEHPHAEHKKH